VTSLGTWNRHGSDRRQEEQNIKAAGTCRIGLGGEQLTLGASALVPAAQGVKDLPWLFRFALRHVVHTAECVQLPILQASRTPVTRR
jgi:hypothetical protein